MTNNKNNINSKNQYFFTCWPAYEYYILLLLAVVGGGRWRPGRARSRTTSNPHGVASHTWNKRGVRSLLRKTHKHVCIRRYIKSQAFIFPQCTVPYRKDRPIRRGKVCPCFMSNGFALQRYYLFNCVFYKSMYKLSIFVTCMNYVKSSPGTVIVRV